MYSRSYDTPDSHSITGSFIIFCAKHIIRTINLWFLLYRKKKFHTEHRTFDNGHSRILSNNVNFLFGMRIPNLFAALAAFQLKQICLKHIHATTTDRMRRVMAEFRRIIPPAVPVPTPDYLL